ncbi:sodium:proton antiporter NhaD [Undibacterium fentianense]|uniref:Sodium:proton antiporter NhaD n=1 Tax=Undibacterium fentianense TaxID=2828728 RepID=A0A941E0Z8_9BURK|nr:sodium:proton antiporter NhaD [Undibacterium fentianense]MBR7799371.1 sodium:proton antiporter NhaD [Undibacterium fentianense]
MLNLLICVFVCSYLAIVFEHAIKVNKTASALIGAGLLWSIYALTKNDVSLVEHQLAESLTSTAQIVFFLMGAMAIVEVIDAHNGFEVITSRIQTKRLSHLVWIVGVITFFLSAILDNLTTTIIMISMLRKLLERREDRLYFAGIIVIAANAGGAWTPIGDVTTTMLWIGGQISAIEIMKGLFLPSLINLLVPLIVTSLVLGNKLLVTSVHGEHAVNLAGKFERNCIFYLGLAILICVPAFKTWTHLPPFIGILFGLGILWMVGDLLHRDKTDEQKERLTLVSALTRIDLSSIVFFVGILLAVAVLEHAHILSSLANLLDQYVGRQDLIVLLIGLASAIVDNVPLVAASMGMYSLSQFPIDSFLWEFMAYCAGTGGSILIIGSAAGVAAMGLEKIDFFWYVKKMSGLALLGYFAGALAYILQYALTHTGAIT